MNAISCRVMSVFIAQKQTSRCWYQRIFWQKSSFCPMSMDVTVSSICRERKIYLTMIWITTTMVMGPLKLSMQKTVGKDNFSGTSRKLESHKNESVIFCKIALCVWGTRKKFDASNRIKIDDSAITCQFSRQFCPFFWWGRPFWPTKMRTNWYGGTRSIASRSNQAKNGAHFSLETKSFWSSEFIHRWNKHSWTTSEENYELSPQESSWKLSGFTSWDMYMLIEWTCHRITLYSWCICHQFNSEVDVTILTRTLGLGATSKLLCFFPGRTFFYRRSFWGMKKSDITVGLLQVFLAVFIY